MPDEPQSSQPNWWLITLFAVLWVAFAGFVIYAVLAAFNSSGHSGNMGG